MAPYQTRPMAQGAPINLVADTEANVTSVDSSQYPNYENDEATFTKFLTEHTIRQTVPDNDNDDDDDDMMLEPTDGPQSIRRVPCYPPLMQRIKNREYFSPEALTFLVEVPLQELVEWDGVRGADLAGRASRNTLRYIQLFAQVIDQVLTGMTASDAATERLSVAAADGTTGPSHLRDTIDVLQEQRLAQQSRHEQRVAQAAGLGGDGTDDALDGGGGIMNDEANVNRENNSAGATEDFPPLLMRRYELRILPLGRRGVSFPFDRQYIPSKDLNTPLDIKLAREGASLREVRSKSIGQLVTLRGMIVRSSDVKPYCQVATYSCDACGAEVYQVIDQKREFMPPRMCPTETCQKRTGPVQETLHLQTRGSKFIKFQELKLQELPSQVPMGHVPRGMSVYCRGELTRQANPGDVITVDGVFLPQRVAEGGFRAMKASLVTTIFLEAQHILVHKKSYDESLLDTLSEEESALLEAEIMKVATSQDPIGKLSQSIAPEIFGHEDIKKALLLQLVGGCTRKLPDGMKIRGDINICLMGDPGVAKSQLLKHVASIAPRGVYTTGKGSSGVGLTAAITKDTTTGEMSLEGGALVLADRGICAIDEFDKMDETDRTAIHEVMEQQTVSIAKAGIVATLNARTAVLAAANPLYSRYNRSKTLSENINLPNSLLSRFDLMFLILDVADMERDIALARHVTSVHKNEGTRQNSIQNKDGADDDNDDPESGDDEDEDKEDSALSPKLLREYIARARKHQPVVPPEVAPYIVEAYVSLRMEDRPGARKGKKSGDQTAMTARQLLSMLRLSQALSRLRFSDYVAREDVDEAIRLTHMSKATLEDEERKRSGTGSRNRREDFVSRIFGILRDYAKTLQTKSLDLKLCEAMVLRKGFTAQQLQVCLEEYEALDVIQINATRTQVHFVN